MNSKIFRSIKTKLTFLITIVIIAISLFVYFYFPKKFEERQLNALKDKVHTLAQIVSYNVAAEVYFKDIDAAVEQILPLLKSNEIKYLVIHTTKDSIFYEFNLPLATLNDYQKRKNNSVTPDNATFMIKTIIKFDTTKMGTLYVGYSLNNLNIEVSEIKDNISKVSFIIFFIGTISVFYIGYIITKPFSKMVEIVEKIRGGNLSIRAPVMNNDEIGYLAKSFNSMVERIEATNEEFEIVNKELEARVLERTKELAESEERFRGLYENSTIGLYRTSASGEILFANPTLQKMLGYNILEEFQNVVKVQDIYVYSDDHEKFLKIIKENEKIIGFEQYWKKKNGEIIFIRESAKATKDENGNILYYDGTVEDVTVKKEYEEKLITAKESAETAVRMKMEFLAQISHEIRTPINSILSYTQLLKSEIIDSVPEELKFSFDMINNGGRRLIRTVDMILNMSELHTGTYEVLPEEVNLVNAVLEPLVGEFKTAADSKNLSIMLINRLGNDRATLTIDTYTVTQIFVNLIDNAIKYTLEGSIEVVAYLNNKGLVCVDVQDTGIGISKKFQETLFEPFTQEEQGYTRKFEGNGLGMALVKEYCNLNDIDITIESEKDKGSLFTITFNSQIFTPQEFIVNNIEDRF